MSVTPLGAMNPIQSTPFNSDPLILITEFLPTEEKCRLADTNKVLKCRLLSFIIKYRNNEPLIQGKPAPSWLVEGREFKDISYHDTLYFALFQRNQGAVLAYPDRKRLYKVAVCLKITVLDFASDRIKDDQKIMLLAAQSSRSAIVYASPRLKRDKEFALTAVSKTGFALFHLAPSFGDDEDVVLAAIRSEGLALQHASPRLRDKLEIALAAVSRDGDALEHVSERLKWSEEILLAAARNKASSLKHTYPKNFDNKKIILAAIENDAAEALCIASIRLKRDSEVVLAAMKKDLSSFRHASQEILKDKTFLLEMIRHFYSPSHKPNLPVVPRELLEDPEIMLEILKHRPDSFDLVPKSLIEDRPFLLKVLSEKGIAIKYAPNWVKSDLEISAAAIKQDINAYEYVNESVKLLPQVFALIFRE